MSESDVNQLLSAIARLEVKVDNLRADNVRGDGIHADFEQRLRSLEKVRWMIAGLCLLLGGSAGTALTRTLGG